MSKGSRRRLPLDGEAAETIALQGLAFLASDPGRLAHFLSLTGLALEDVRGRAAAPEVLTAVLSHLTADESLLLTFAAEAHVAPDAIAPALTLLQEQAE